MKKGKYISNVIEDMLKNAHKDRLNFIQADTGQGKTVAAIHTIPELLSIQPSRCLILIDTNAGKDNKISSEGCKQFGTKGNCPTIMTYAEFGSALKNGKLYSSDYDYIACDEVHNLAKYARIDQVNIISHNPDYDPTTIALILTRESLNYRAFETLKRWCSIGAIWVFGFSATPRLLEEWNEAEGFLNKIKNSEQLIVYEVLEKYSYGDIHTLLTANPNHKRLIHAPTVEQVEQFTQEIKDSTGRQAIGLWSRNNKQKMNSEQIHALECITNDERFPDEVDDIVATEAYSTGYNIKDENVKEIIIHTGNQDIQTQFKGRKRDDLPILRLYDIKTKKATKRKQNKIEQDLTVPTEFLDVKLDSQAKKQLIQTLNFQYGWPTLKKVLSKKYTISEKRNRISVISIHNDSKQCDGF